MKYFILAQYLAEPYGRSFQLQFNPGELVKSAEEGDLAFKERFGDLRWLRINFLDRVAFAARHKMMSDLSVNVRHSLWTHFFSLPFTVLESIVLLLGTKRNVQQ